MNFLFDLINDIAGYTHKYYEETRAKINHEGLIQKYRAEKRKYEEKGKKISDSPLLGDKSLHCLLVIESIHELLDMPACNYEYKGRVESAAHGSPLSNTSSLAKDYLDALLLRLSPGTDGWYRNHFPVILESNRSYYFNELIYD